MNFKTNTFLSKSLLLLFIIIYNFSFAQVTYTNGPTNLQINSSLIGDNVTISNSNLVAGVRNTQVATFTNGLAAGLNMSKGIFFGTGINDNLLTNNSAAVTSGNPGGTTIFSDADLATVDGNANRDMVSYTFSVTIGPKASTLNIKYQFGSEEYPDFVGSVFDDAFGFFVTGPGITGTFNMAKLPNNQPTSINKVNFGVLGAQSSGSTAYDGSQSALYTNNGHNTTVNNGKLVTNTNPGPFPVFVQFNGITKLITYTLSGLTPGATYTFKIVIADTSDQFYDSGVFVNAIYATATLVANNDAYTIVSGGNSSTTVLNNDTVNGASPASLSDVSLSQISTTNSGVNLNPATGLISVAPGTPAGVYVINYQICDLTFLDNCKTATATVTVTPNDSDGDDIDNFYDLDDDNDGILDSVEDVCATKTEGPAVFSNTFGTDASGATAPLTSPDPNIVTAYHTQTTGDPSDGSYAITTSNARSQLYTKTNLSPTNNKDAGYNDITAGSVNGRYLMINVGSAASNNQAIYRVSNLPVTVGRNYRFRIDMAGLADNLTDVPRLQLTIRDFATNVVLATANSDGIGAANDDVWRRLNMEFVAPSSAVTIEIVNLQPNGGNGNDLGIDNVVLAPYSCDIDADGIPNSLDVDSDGDGCPDALEGSENVRITQVYPLNFATTALRGQIRVTHDGLTAGTTQVEIISTDASANGVPQLVNNGTNNPNSTPANSAGVADNTDGTADVGQGIGSSQDLTVQDPDCLRCFKTANTAAGIDTTHGITALNRAGSNNGNWPMKIKSAYTVMDAKTLGFVINRLSTAQIGSLVPVTGMAVYDTDVNCLKIYDGTGWFCYTKQTCDQ